MAGVLANCLRPGSAIVDSVTTTAIAQQSILHVDTATFGNIRKTSSNSQLRWNEGDIQKCDLYTSQNWPCYIRPFFNRVVPDTSNNNTIQFWENMQVTTSFQ